MMRVLFSPEVRLYFRELSELLIEKEYVGFEDTAIQYVRELIFNIQDTLENRLKHPAPPYFDRYGKDLHYAVFKRNNNTQWYVFFETYEEEKTYVITFIGNNHTIAQYIR
jgi:hypothetical protein